MGLFDSVGDMVKFNPGLSNSTGIEAGKAINQAAGDMIGGIAKQALGGNMHPENGGGFYPYGAPELNYGGYEGGAQDWSNIGLGRMGQTNKGQGYALREMQYLRDPQAYENQVLSDREAMTRGWDQSGALQLSREAAMGNAPSAAAYMMASGLDQAMAAQQGTVGGARGLAGLNLAQGNAQASAANQQANAYNAAGQLRANEMATARDQYGRLAGQVRDQDLSRLQMGNQMGQFNAGLNDQYRLGMGQMANQFGNQDIEWYKAAQIPQSAQLAGSTSSQQIGAESFNQNQALNAGVAQARRDAAQRAQDRMWSFAGTAVGMGGNIAASYYGNPANRKP